ncbi:MAG: hypothetical protein JRH20_26580, partial [Deltaproteobacteria bacterium]|nr:hypothetical protein [Deltaproteobacteria bacterium]
MRCLLAAGSALIVLALTGACEERQPTAVDGSVDGTPADGTLDIAPVDARPLGPCVVAVRIDDCCQPAVPAGADEVQNDACLVFWPAMLPLDEACVATWSPACGPGDCITPSPPSRVAARIDGACEFADECTAPEDCVFATDMRSCCPCANVYPPSLVAQDACLVNDEADAPASCLPDCTNVQCEQCMPPPLVQCTFTASSKFNSCQGQWP